MSENKKKNPDASPNITEAYSEASLRFDGPLEVHDRVQTEIEYKRHLQKLQELKDRQSGKRGFFTDDSPSDEEKNSIELAQIVSLVNSPPLAKEQKKSFPKAPEQQPDKKKKAVKQPQITSEMLNLTSDERRYKPYIKDFNEKSRSERLADIEKFKELDKEAGRPPPPDPLEKHHL